jgi:hypothetical protein
MSKTIWIATDRTGACITYAYLDKPQYDAGEFLSTRGGGLRLDKSDDWPPPGECWEMAVTRKSEPSGHAATIERLTKERDEARDAGRWFKTTLITAGNGGRLFGANERWPWLETP